VGKSLRRWLYLTHRWLGIIACLFIALWFISGVVMIYVPYPSLKPEERRAASPPIAWREVSVQPAAALAAVDARELPNVLRLQMERSRPVWRMEWPDKRRDAVWADTGLPLHPVDKAEAMRWAAVFGGGPSVSARLIERDQWTVAQGFDPHRPMWLVELGDAADTHIYVARRTGEIVQSTTAFERGWNWLGAIPHWLYLTEIRTNPKFWHQLVVWTSGPALLVGLTGMWVGILRLVRRGRWATPYHGWMRWHHLLGLAGGLTMMTWMFSGWLSMHPFDWFARGGNAAVTEDWRGATPDTMFPPLDFDRLAKNAAGAREAQIDFVNGKPVLRAWSAGEKGARALLTPAGQPLTLSNRDLTAAARAAMQPHRIRSVEQLTQPDIHWYGRWQQRPLPVLRIQFDDPAETWLHVDVITGEIAGQSTASSRTYRWLFNFLHDFDLPWLLDRRPLRDPLMWLLLALGTGMSISGIVIGWRRIRRPARPQVAGAGKGNVPLPQLQSRYTRSPQ
jgi:hypothetical protein